MEKKRIESILDGKPRTPEETERFFKEAEEFEREREEYFKQLEAQNNKQSTKAALKDNKQ